MGFSSSLTTSSRRLPFAPLWFTAPSSRAVARALLTLLSNACLKAFCRSVITNTAHLIIFNRASNLSHMPIEASDILRGGGGFLISIDSALY